MPRAVLLHCPWALCVSAWLHPKCGLSPCSWPGDNQELPTWSWQGRNFSPPFSPGGPSLALPGSHANPKPKPVTCPCGIRHSSYPRPSHHVSIICGLVRVDKVASHLSRTWHERKSVPQGKDTSRRNLHMHPTPCPEGQALALSSWTWPSMIGLRFPPASALYLACSPRPGPCTCRVPSHQTHALTSQHSLYSRLGTSSRKTVRPSGWVLYPLGCTQNALGPSQWSTVHTKAKCLCGAGGHTAGGLTHRNCLINVCIKDTRENACW